MMRVLVAFASKRGGTARLADMISDALTEAGYEAILQPARDVRSLAGVDAVIVAGPLYAYRWHRDARRFVRRNTAALRNLPIWLVSSGPLDDSAEKSEIPPTPQLRKWASRVGAVATSPSVGDSNPTPRAFRPARWRKRKPATGATPHMCAAGSRR
jgi:menaquinone-dependent protoporphyrinogen oxidase